MGAANAATAADAGAAAQAGGGGGSGVIYTEEMLKDLAKRREEARRPSTLSAYKTQFMRLDKVSGRVPCSCAVR